MLRSSQLTVQLTRKMLAPCHAIIEDRANITMCACTVHCHLKAAWCMLTCIRPVYS